VREARLADIEKGKDFSMSKYCFGIDIGGTAVKVGLFNTEGTLLNNWDFTTVKTGNGKDILKDSANFVEAKIEELKLDKADILGIGIGIPGPVKENGDVLELANLGMGYFNIEEEMKNLTTLKVKAANDANVAALGELWMGGGKGYHNMVLVTLGTGVGGGIILGGTVVAGSNGAGGEIGHIFVNPEETKACGCGKKGCLEQYASATGIVRLAKSYLESSDEASKMRNYKELSAKAVFDCAKEGDNLALETVEKACYYLGVSMAHIAQVIDPEVFVIGGGVSKAGEIITETMKKYYNEHVMDALKNREFRLAVLGNDAGIYGAAKLILE
jgi:glucokinase